MARRTKMGGRRRGKRKKKPPTPVESVRECPHCHLPHQHHDQCGHFIR